MRGYTSVHTILVQKELNIIKSYSSLLCDSAAAETDWVRCPSRVRWETFPTVCEIPEFSYPFFSFFSTEVFYSLICFISLNLMNLKSCFILSPLFKFLYIIVWNCTWIHAICIKLYSRMWRYFILLILFIFGYYRNTSAYLHCSIWKLNLTEQEKLNILY